MPQVWTMAPPEPGRVAGTVPWASLVPSSLAVVPSARVFESSTFCLLKKPLRELWKQCLLDVTSGMPWVGLAFADASVERIPVAVQF